MTSHHSASPKLQSRPVSQRLKNQTPSPPHATPQQASQSPPIPPDASSGSHVDALEPYGPENGILHRPTCRGADSSQKERNGVPAIKQYLEGLDVVGDHGPAEGARRGGYVVIPDDH